MDIPSIDNAGYRYNKEELRFLLWEMLRVDEIYGNCFDIDRETVNILIDHAEKFAVENISPNRSTAEAQGCYIAEDGTVHIPESYYDLHKKMRDLGYYSIGVNEEYGGHLPYCIGFSLAEMFIGADPSYMSYMGLASGVIKLIDKFCIDDAIRSEYCNRLAAGEWSGAICMTEPDAGSDVGAISTAAHKLDNGQYSIKGEKIFITGGMHELSENIVYAVLARTSKLLPGPLGLSCFLVPRYWINEKGQKIENNVKCIRLEKKMGLKASVTAHMEFGLSGECRGILLGESENSGLKQIHTVMNFARLGTALYSVSIASAAYHHALAYANDRVQGGKTGKLLYRKKDRLPIINHVDVQRMILEMKAKVEGMRALTLKTAFHISCTEVSLDNTNISEGQREKHRFYADLLTPLAKAYCSDQGWRVCELAIQTHGGYGYLSEFPVEQCARDIKIMSIWEGTNYFQSMDLLRDKLAYCTDSAIYSMFVKDVKDFSTQHRANIHAAKDVEIFSRAIDQFELLSSKVSDMAMNKNFDDIAFIATRYLEFMSELVVSWILIEASIKARQIRQFEGNKDYSNIFIEEKIVTCSFYIKNILASGISRAEVLSDDMMPEGGACIAAIC